MSSNPENTRISGEISDDARAGTRTTIAESRTATGKRRVWQMNFDLLRLLDGNRQGSHGTRRGRGYVLARAAETPHGLDYRGLKALGLKGRHIEALVAEWRRQGLWDGTMRNRMAHLRWLAKQIGKPGTVRKDNASYGIGTGG